MFCLFFFYDVFDEVADPDEIGMRKTNDVVVNVSDKSGLQKFSLLLNDLIQYNRLIHVYTGLKFMAFDCLYKGMIVKKIYRTQCYNIFMQILKKKKEFAYLPTHTQSSWVGFGQTEIFLIVA